MKYYIEKTLLGCGAIVLSVSFLTACNTAQGLAVGTEKAVVGTVQGAEKDVNSAAHAVAGSSKSNVKATAHHKAHKKMVKKTTNMSSAQ